MSIEYGLYSNIGDSLVNEDTADVYEGAVSAYILADGLGGHGGGDVASRLVADVVKTTVSQEQTLSKELLIKCFRQAQEILLAQQRALNRQGAMKTTLVILLISGNTAMWGHIGDSRLYYIKKGKVKSRTLDHSVPQMLVKMKKIKEKDIRHHSDRNILIKVMGVEWGGKDMFDIDCSGMKLSTGDCFVLCSDGLWEWVEDKVIASLASQNANASSIACQLVDEAYSNGMGSSRDNITVVVAKCV